MTPDQGSRQTSCRTRGAKNLWTRTDCQLHIATYNARRSMGNEERLTELHYELIKWDILGIVEVRRRGEECLNLKSGHTIL